VLGFILGSADGPTSGITRVGLDVFDGLELVGLLVGELLGAGVGCIAGGGVSPLQFPLPFFLFRGTSFPVASSEFDFDRFPDLEPLWPHFADFFFADFPFDFFDSFDFFQERRLLSSVSVNGDVIVWKPKALAILRLRRMN
jgi:hypothetical protein